MPRIDVSAPILDLDGQLVAGPNGPLTYRSVIVDALTRPLLGDENMPWQERRAIFELAEKVAGNDLVDTTGADLVRVISRLSQVQSTVVVGRVGEAMDNRAEIAAAEAEAIRLQDLRLAQEAVDPPAASEGPQSGEP